MRIRFLGAAGLLAGALLPACANPDPRQVVLYANARTGVVLMRVEPARVPYDVNITAYDENTQSIDDGPLVPGAHFHISNLGQPSYVAMIVQPGTYIFQDVAHQGNWALCFNNNSKVFTVQANQAVFLGDFNPNPHLAQLDKLVVQYGDVTIHSGEIKHYFDPEIFPPQISEPSATSPDFVAAQQYVAANMPSAKGRLVPAQYSSGKFGVGHVWTGDRVCGGFFKSDVKKDAAAQ